MSANRADDWGRLMAAAQSGDSTAYACLLREILPYVRAIVRHHHSAPDRLEDVLQDVLLTIHRVRHTYDPGRPFTAWIGAIAHRRSVDAIRRKVRIDAVEKFSSIAYETYADPAANRGVAEHENNTVLAGAIATLPPGQREAVELLKLKELSLADASEVSGKSVSALKVNMHRALRSLQKTLGRRTDE